MIVRLYMPIIYDMDVLEISFSKIVGILIANINLIGAKMFAKYIVIAKIKREARRK